MLKDHAHTTSCSICGEIKITSCSRDALGYFLKEEEEDEENNFSGMFSCSYGALDWLETCSLDPLNCHYC